MGLVGMGSLVMVEDKEEDKEDKLTVKWRKMNPERRKTSSLWSGWGRQAHHGLVGMGSLGLWKLHFILAKEKDSDREGEGEKERENII
jgi:hypothetical protein